MRTYDPVTSARGVEHFNAGAVQSIACLQPGVGYVARWREPEHFEIKLSFNAQRRRWIIRCTCSPGWGCAHGYAALARLRDGAGDKAGSEEAARRCAAIAKKPGICRARSAPSA